MEKTLEQRRVEESGKKKARTEHHAAYLERVELLAMNNREVSSLCAVHIRTVERWSAGDRTVPMTVINFLESCRMCQVNYPPAWGAIKDRFIRGRR